MSFVSSPIGASRPSSGSNPTSGPMLMLMTNESIGGETDQSLNCPICQLHLRNPRVLPCLHSFCLLCLQTHVGQSRHFPCPVCRMQVSLDDSTLDNLPMNTYFSGLFDLGDSIENGFDSNSKTQDTFASSMQMKKYVPQVKQPPLRQPYYNSSGGASFEGVGDRKLSQEMSQASSSASLNSYLPEWPNSATETSIWRNQFDFSALSTGSSSSSSNVLVPATITATTVDLPLATVVSSSGWQMLDGTRALPPDPNKREPLKNAFTNVLKAAAAVVPASSTSWSSVVGSKPPSSSSSYQPPGFFKGAATTKLPTCSSCDDKQLVTSRCRDCNEDLCDSCVDAHQRVSLTRHHVIVRYPETSSTSSILTTVSNPSFSLMSGLTQPTTPLFGFPRDSDVMKVYADAVEKAKADCDKLMFKARQGQAQIEDAKNKVAEMESRVDMRYKAIYADINSIIENYQAEIKNRGQVLLSRLDSIHQVKMASLAHQKQELSSTTICLAQVADQLSSCSMSGRELELINTCNKAMSTIKEVQNKCGTLAIHEEDTILFEAPNPAFIKSLSNFGFVGGSAFAPNSSAEGEGLKKATLGKDSRFVVCIRDQLNEQCQTGRESVKISILDPESRQVRFNIADCQNGLYKVSWKPVMEGDHLLSVTIKDRHIKDSPFRVRVQTGRNYNNIGTPVFTFGIEGEKEGELCRPWGVCCSREGYILVANRSNNRIEVFSAQGTFLYKFGTGGKQDGQFDRPASVFCDTKNRVIISDKDNHRVQIFTIEGKFLLTFGEKGSKPGQFNYPWDVACNSKDQILVSDTRNHRIQLFSPNGEYLNKYGFEGAMWKHFDSPRGVCFTADDQAVITDFNNHRLLVIKADFQGAQFLGKEGTEDGAFTRPNGVAVDEEGHIIVADSRNDRIQIFSSSGAFVKSFGSKGTGPGEFDRPSGICISQDGLVIVVDFGNNRVQVF